MPERLLYQEWRRQTSTIKYPFEDGASLTNKEGFAILEGVFLDGALYPVGGGVGLHLSRVEVTHDTVTLWVGDLNRSLLASARFSLVGPPPVLALADDHGRPAGVLVSAPERLGVFQSWDVGVHDFTPEQTPFVAAVCLPTPQAGLRGLLLDDGTLLTGDVYLVGGEGVVLSEDFTAGPGDRRVVRVDVVGDPLFRRRLCAPTSLFVTPRFVKSLLVLAPNGSFTVVPDAGGGVTLSAGNALRQDTVLRVRTTPAGITFEAVGTPAD